MVQAAWGYALADDHRIVVLPQEMFTFTSHLSPSWRNVEGRNRCGKNEKLFESAAAHVLILRQEIHVKHANDRMHSNLLWWIINSWLLQVFSVRQHSSEFCTALMNYGLTIPPSIDWISSLVIPKWVTAAPIVSRGVAVQLTVHLNLSSSHVVFVPSMSVSTSKYVSLVFAC